MGSKLRAVKKRLLDASGCPVISPEDQAAVQEAGRLRARSDGDLVRLVENLDPMPELMIAALRAGLLHGAGFDINAEKWFGWRFFVTDGTVHRVRMSWEDILGWTTEPAEEPESPGEGSEGDRLVELTSEDSEAVLRLLEPEESESCLE